MDQPENIGKYKQAVLEDPSLADHASSKESKRIFDVLMNNAEWLDAIDTEDKAALDKLFQNIKKKHQKWLSDLVMNTKVFKYYTLIYLGSPHGYFWARKHRTKEIDKKVEQSLKSQWYVADEIAKIFASKRYVYHLEEFLIYEAKKSESLDEYISTAAAKADEYCIWNEDYIIDSSLTSLVEERSPINRSERKFLPEKISFLKERLLS